MTKAVEFHPVSRKATLDTAKKAHPSLPEIFRELSALSKSHQDGDSFIHFKPEVQDAEKNLGLVERIGESVSLYIQSMVAPIIDAVNDFIENGISSNMSNLREHLRLPKLQSFVEGEVNRRVEEELADQIQQEEGGSAASAPPSDAGPTEPQFA